MAIPDVNHQRAWTFMVYLAGDNNLEGFSDIDLAEMKASGSTDEVAIVAQCDRLADPITRRYYLTAGRTLEDDCVATLPETNTGDPATLIDFVTWATETYPARQYALILWNHGTGWKDDDIYHIAGQKGLSQQITRGQVRGLVAGKASRSLFRTTIQRLVVETVEQDRAILFDDSSADFLDNLELRHVLEEVTKQLGKPLDLVGFDACLMNMLEVHYQIRDLCRVVVGSQEVEPGDGWPYDAILGRLTGEPGMNAPLLGKSIVDAYIHFYQTTHPNLPVTQSAVRMEGIEEVGRAVSNFGQVLLDSLDDHRTVGIVFHALRSAQTFTDRDYIDLVHFCRLVSELSAGSPIGNEASQVCTLLTGAGSSILACGYHGDTVQNACGLSIYLPTRVLSPLYAQLQFAQHFVWDDFLNAFVHPG